MDPSSLPKYVFAETWIKGRRSVSWQRAMLVQFPPISSHAPACPVLGSEPKQMNNTHFLQSRVKWIKVLRLWLQGLSGTPRRSRNLGRFHDHQSPNWSLGDPKRNLLQDSLDFQASSVYWYQLFMVCSILEFWVRESRDARKKQKRHTAE